MKAKNILTAAAVAIGVLLIIASGITTNEAMPESAMFTINAIEGAITPCPAGDVLRNYAIPYSKIKADKTLRSYRLDYDGPLYGRPRSLLSTWLFPAESRWDKTGYWLY